MYVLPAPGCVSRSVVASAAQYISEAQGRIHCQTYLSPEHAHSLVLIGWPAGTGRAEEVPAKHPNPRHTTLPFLLIPHKVISLVVSFRPATLCSISHDSAQPVPRVEDLQPRVTDSGCGTERERQMHLCYLELLWNFSENILVCH